MRDGRLDGVYSKFCTYTGRTGFLSLSAPLVCTQHRPQCCVEIGAEPIGLAVLTQYIQLQTWVHPPLFLPNVYKYWYLFELSSSSGHIHRTQWSEKGVGIRMWVYFHDILRTLPSVVVGVVVHSCEGGILLLIVHDLLGAILLGIPVPGFSFWIPEVLERGFQNYLYVSVPPGSREEWLRDSTLTEL